MRSVMQKCCLLTEKKKRSIQTGIGGEPKEESGMPEI